MFIRCPKCSDGGDVPNEMKGRKLKCVKCGTVFVVSVEHEPALMPQNDPVPQATFSVKVEVDPMLTGNKIKIGEKVYDLDKMGRDLYIMGQRDEMTSPNCIPFLGMKFHRDDPEVLRFEKRKPGGGRGHRGGRMGRTSNDFISGCRCYVALADIIDQSGDAKDKELLQTPGLEYVRNLIREDNVDLLTHCYGKTRTEYLTAGKITPEELYTPKWKLRLVSELTEIINARSPMPPPI